MIRAYHFVGNKLRDGRDVPPDGEWLIHEGPVEMCVGGLHASRHACDAMKYAPGNVLCLVECDDVAAEDSDKLVCSRRRIVRRVDASRMLREFAADCAERVWYLVRPEDQLAAAWAIDAARRFARGECERDELDAAAATYAATYAADVDAAYAAYAAAAAATYAAAAYAAAAAAAYAAERKWQRKEFARRVKEIGL